MISALLKQFTPQIRSKKRSYWNLPRRKSSTIKSEVKEEVEDDEKLNEMKLLCWEMDKVREKVKYVSQALKREIMIKTNLVSCVVDRPLHGSKKAAAKENGVRSTALN